MCARREPTQVARISELREDRNPAFHLNSDFQISIGNYIIKFLKLKSFNPHSAGQRQFISC